MEDDTSTPSLTQTLRIIPSSKHLSSSNKIGPSPPDSHVRVKLREPEAVAPNSHSSPTGRMSLASPSQAVRSWELVRVPLGPRQSGEYATDSDSALSARRPGYGQGRDRPRPPLSSPPSPAQARAWSATKASGQANNEDSMSA